MDKQKSSAKIINIIPHIKAKKEFNALDVAKKLGVSEKILKSYMKSAGVKL